MARIEKYIIDKILDAARIDEVIGDFVTLKKKGVRYLGLCPFHQDRHLGSFVVYPKGNCFKCFKCEAKGGTVDFLMMYEKLSYPDAIRWLAKKYNIDIDMEGYNPIIPTRPREQRQPLPTLNLPMQMVTSREQIDNDNLVNWMRNGINFDSLQRRRLEDVLKAYHVGHAKNGFTIFWMIDEQKRVRTGKMMLYSADGHRDRTAKYNFDFIHSILSRRYDANGYRMEEGPYPYPQLYDPDKQECRLCYFGMHLLDAYKRNNVEQAVCIVESEKTALIMAATYGNNAKNVWMACGGANNLTKERLMPILEQRRPIILYPDRDAIGLWRSKADQLDYHKLSIDTKPVTDWWLPEDGPKADIADVTVRQLNAAKTLTTISYVKALMPQSEKLIDANDLTPITDNETEQ